MSFADVNSPEFKMRYACMAGQLDLMRSFLDGGVDIDHCGDGGSFLSDAAHNEQEAAVGLLLELGADPNLDSPLWYALNKKNYAIADVLVGAGARINPVNERGDFKMSRRWFWTDVTPELAQWLIDRGTDFEKADASGRTALSGVRAAQKRGRLKHPEILDLIEAALQ